MVRCWHSNEIGVYHKGLYGGNGLDNAAVLCKRCHAATTTFGDPGNGLPPFDYDTIEKALVRAGYQCECTVTGDCH